jgi:dihydrofolate synthase/folylpolyglutamate synthase
LAIADLLEKFEQFGVKLGLEPSLKLLANLGNPHWQVPILHVAGSNGKGSVCAYLSAILTEAGYRVGRYTSPHLLDWNERIVLNEEAIASEDLEAVLHQVVAAIPADRPSPTQFEIITAAAWLYFAQQDVDLAVMEVGLGGRLDATNVCDLPLVSIITSLSREHWQRLGPTLADIAREKAGILKPGCLAVIGQIPPEAKVVVDQRIAELGCPVLYPPPATDLGNGWAEYAGISYRLPLHGSIQLGNSALAITAVQWLRQEGWNISDWAIADGIAKTKWPARLQWFTWQNQRILIDGAHNAASAEVLRQFVDSLTERQQPLVRPLPISSTSPSSSPPPPISWVMGILSTKDHADIFKALLRPGDRLYLCPVPDHSSAEPEQLAVLAQTVCPDLAGCQVYPDVVSALKAALEQDLTLLSESKGAELSVASSRPLTVLCGSLYLIGHFLRIAQSSCPSD